VALSQARTNYAQALYDCLMALAELERAVGETSFDKEKINHQVFYV